MKKQIFLGLIALFLSSCSFFHPHKMDIEQGNVFTDADLKRIHKGMTKSQVKFIMGPAMTQHIFSPNRIDYVYTSQPGYQDMEIKRVSVYFDKNGRVSHIKKYSTGSQA